MKKANYVILDVIDICRGQLYKKSSIERIILYIIGDRNIPFGAFATNEAIQATEIYEYAQKLSNPDQVHA